MTFILYEKSFENTQVIVVNCSNVSITFGYYAGSLKGTILSFAASIFSVKLNVKS